MIYELNSTLKACLIAGFFPYFLFFTQNIKKGKYKFNAILIIAIITLFISVILESRTLTGATLLSLILWHKESSWITKHFSLILSGSLLLIITLLLIKWHSSLGRLFIWKTAIGEISDYWLSGIGKGNFKYYYAEWQSEWFRNNANFSSFHLVADCPEYAFNEYLCKLPRKLTI